MTSSDGPGPRRSEAETFRGSDQKVYGSAIAATPRVKTAPAMMSAGEVFSRWNYAVESSSWRPHVVSADPAAPGKCLCGEFADFVVQTNWFGGRHSRDPVCGRHLDEVVSAIRKEQARRNGG